MTVLIELFHLLDGRYSGERQLILNKSKNKEEM